MPELLKQLFSSDGFMPHGHCYLWNPGLVWLHVTSDALTALSYTTIPFTLIYLVRKRRDVPFHWMFLCFGTFIIACGATHAMEIWTLWTPTYWLSGVVKAITAAASVPTAVLLITLVPKALAIPTAQQLASAHAELRKAHEVLEARVQERTAELSQKNADLVREMAERKEAEEAVRNLRAEREADAKFRALLEAAPDAMVIVDRDGRVVLINAQAEKVFGYAREEILGASVDILVPDGGRSAHARHRAGYFADPKVRAMGSGLDLFGRRKDGSAFPVEISLSPLETKDGMLVSSAIRDITARRETEEALRHARDIAEAARNELESFSYSVAHDLRAPLRAINGFSQALLEDLGEKLEGEPRSYLKSIGDGASRMGQLIDALLELSRVSRRELTREVVNLSELAEGVIAQLRTSDPGRSAQFVVEPGLVAEGDSRLLRALLENLLGNAWKFTRNAAEARIELGRTRVDGAPGYVVRDNGAGFDMTYADKLFAPFQRLHSASEFVGTGIGLATVQRIVRRHGGKISGRGAVNVGAEFSFTLEDSKKSSSWVAASAR